MSFYTNISCSSRAQDGIGEPRLVCSTPEPTCSATSGAGSAFLRPRTGPLARSICCSITECLLGSSNTPKLIVSHRLALVHSLSDALENPLIRRLQNSLTRATTLPRHRWPGQRMQIILKQEFESGLSIACRFLPSCWDSIPPLQVFNSGATASATISSIALFSLTLPRTIYTMAMTRRYLFYNDDAVFETLSSDR